MGYLDGNIEVTSEELAIDVTAHQEGQNILDAIRTGKKVEVKMTLKESSAQKLALLYSGAGGEVETAIAEISSVTCVADVAGSLNNKYFFLNAKGDVTKHYVWFNVNSLGVDPAIAGRTAVPITLATNASAATVAAAVQAAVDALSDYAASVSGAVVTVTNSVAGSASDASAQNSGFTVEVTTQGVDAGIIGWGTSKDFAGQFALAKKLTLHPKRLAATDHSRDFSFWKAYPMLESFTFSGEEILMFPVTFKVFKDPARPESINYFGIGESL